MPRLVPTMVWMFHHHACLIPTLRFRLWSGQPPSTARPCFFWANECFQFLKFSHLRNCISFWGIFELRTMLLNPVDNCCVMYTSNAFNGTEAHSIYIQFQTMLFDLLWVSSRWLVALNELATTGDTNVMPAYPVSLRSYGYGWNCTGDIARSNYPKFILYYATPYHQR